MNPKIKQQIEEEALRRFPEKKLSMGCFDDDEFMERAAFKRGAEWYHNNIKESVNEDLIKVLMSLRQFVIVRGTSSMLYEIDIAIKNAEDAKLSAYNQENNEREKKVFTENDITQLQDRIHKIVGNGEVMQEFNKLLGVNAG